MNDVDFEFELIHRDEINTGTSGSHSEYGITKFKYEVESGDNVVNTGEGAIPQNTTEEITL